MFPIPGHLVMRLDAGFIELPAGLVFRDSVAPLPEHAAERAVNHATDEKKGRRRRTMRRRNSG